MSITRNISINASAIAGSNSVICGNAASCGFGTGFGSANFIESFEALTEHNTGSPGKEQRIL